MSYTSDGIEAIKRKDYASAFSLLEEGFFNQGEIKAGCYLAQMYYDERITPRTEESVAKAMLLWRATMDYVPSSKHKLGVTLFGFKKPEARKQGLEYIREAAKSGYSVSFCVLGILEYHKGNYSQAIDYLSKYDNIENDAKALFAYIDSLMIVAFQNEDADRICNYFPPNASFIIELGKKYINKFIDVKMPDAGDFYCRLGKIVFNTPTDDDDEKGDLYSLLIRKSAELDCPEGIVRFINWNYKIYSVMFRDFPEDKSVDECIRWAERGVKLGDLECKVLLAILIFYYTNPDADAIYRVRELLSEAEREGENIDFAKAGIYFDLGLYEAALPCLEKIVMKIVDYDYIYRYFYAFYEATGGPEYGENDYDKFESKLFEIALKTWDIVYSSDYDHAKRDYRADKKHTLNIILGDYYFINLKTPEDLKKCVYHYTLAFDVPYAWYKLTYLGLYFNNEIISADDGIKYGDKLIEAEDYSACGYLGDFYRLNSSPTKAVDMYMKAYYGGDKDAAEKISEMYMKGEITGRRDKKKAAEWKAKAQEME